MAINLINRNEVRQRNHFSWHALQKNRIPISIIVTAYNVVDYIEECLDSIARQTYFRNNNQYEILLGIDCCPATLEKVKAVKHRYQNLVVLYARENVGTYVLSNTLMSMAKHDRILRFDSDDVMHPKMINEVLSVEGDIVRFSYLDFRKTIRKTMPNNNHYAHGVFLIKRKTLELAGGFRAWCCAADSELLYRMKNFCRCTEIDLPLFYRRMHDNSLTHDTRTDLQSEIRKKYKKEVRVYERHENPYIVPEVTDNYVFLK